MQGPINKQVNLFSVEITKKEPEISSRVDSVITTKVKANSIGAAHLKSQLGYNESDAEIWVFVAGDASSCI